MSEILLLPFSKNKRPPYWNSTSGLQYGHMCPYAMMATIILPIFIDMCPSRPKLLAFIKNLTWRWPPSWICNGPPTKQHIWSEEVQSAHLFFEIRGFLLSSFMLENSFSCTFCEVFFGS